MPDPMDRASRVERQLFLRTLSLGKVSGAAEAFAEAMRDVFFPAGTVIYREGDGADVILFLMSGEIHLTKDGEDPWIMKDRDVVGVLAAMQDKPHTRTATAVADTRALAVAVDDWLDMLEDNFELTRRAVLGVARSLHALNVQLAPTGGFPPPPPVAEDEGPAAPLDMVERIILLREVPAFGAANVQALAGLSKVLEERRFEPGDVLFRGGDPPGAFFIVARGLVEIAREDPVVRAGFGPGALVGGYSILGQPQQQYTAHVMVPTTAFRVREEDYFDLMEDHFEMARSVLSEMAHERERLMRRVSDRKRLARESEGDADRGGP